MDPASAKYIAKRNRRRGLQKTKFYCQVCERQCLDEHGFKLHIQSDSHVRKLKGRMGEMGNSGRRLVDDYSQQFLRSFLGQLRRSHGEKHIGANRFYQEYIQDKEHVHLNSTRWGSLTALVRFLEDSGSCDIVITDEGLSDTDAEKFSIAYIDKGRGSVSKRRKKDKEKGLETEKETGERLLEEQVKRGEERAAEKAHEETTEPVKSGPSGPSGPIKIKLAKMKPKGRLRSKNVFKRR